MVKEKDVINFLNHAVPTILDLTNDNIRTIENDKELMALLKLTAKDYENGYGDTVGISTDLSPYQSMGWYLASALRNDIQHYYRIRYDVVMSTFLSSRYGTIFDKPECSELVESWRKRDYKKFFNRELPN